MSEELERMLSRPGRARPAVTNPRLRVTPCVQGGLPLDGGPRDTGACALDVAEPRELAR